MSRNQLRGICEHFTWHIYNSINRTFRPRGPSSAVTAEEGPRGRNVLFIELYAT